MLNKALATINQYNMIIPGDIVLVGVSGGVDSVALLHALYNLKNKLDINLHVAHLNHCFRGAEAKDDAEFVRELSVELGLPYTIEEFDVPVYIKETGLSPQEAARAIRYNFFERIAEKIGANKVALAHNANDQAETVLFNFLRGSGSEGIGGIPPLRDNFIIRPLIEVWRFEIEKYCELHNLNSRLDKSNTKTIYTRNKIRLELMPHLEKEYNPSIQATLVKTGDILRAENIYLEEITEQLSEELAEIKDSQVVINLPKFVEQPLPLQRRLIKFLYTKLCGVNNLEYKHIEEVMAFSVKGTTGSRIDLPGSYRILKDYEKLIIAAAESITDIEFAYTVEIPGDTYIKEINRLLRAEVIKGGNLVQVRQPDKNIAYLDFTKIPPGLVVRNRRDGDVFSPLGLHGKKKIKDFLIDSKITRSLRNTIPMVAAQEEIIWIAGVRIGEKWKVTDKTTKVLKLQLI